MSESIVRELAAAVDSSDLREVRAQRAAEIVRAARGYRWVGIYEVDDDRIAMLGHTGATAPVSISFGSAEGASGDVVRTGRAVVRNGERGAEAIVPILGAESGIVIGTLEADADRPLDRDDEDFLDRCVTALMPLFE